MPSQKKQQYEDALGSIFDFIYSESQKPADKVKPVKVTGVDGTSEVVDAIGAVLENPLLFVTNNTMESFLEAVDIDMAKFSLTDRGRGMSFNLKDIGKIVSDPKKYVDDAFAKMEAIRKSQRFAHGGEAMRSLIAGVWARKEGLDWDTQKGLLAAGRMQDTYVGGKGSPAYGLDMMSRNEELLDRHFVQEIRTLDREQLRRRYGNERGDKLYEKYLEIQQNFPTADNDKLVSYYSDRELFALLEGEEMMYRANTAQSPQEGEKYEKAANFISHMNVEADLKKFLSDGNDKLRDLQNRLRASNDAAEKRDLKNQIKDLRSDMNLARGYNWAGEFGRWEGVLNTAKGYYQGNLIPDILNGKFFEDKYNQIRWLQPTYSEKLITGEGNTVNLHWAKSTGRNVVKDSYYESMTALYYLSPVTWVKTLTTGEGFAYLAKVSERKFKAQMGAMLSANVPGFDMGNFLGQLMQGNSQNAIRNLGALSQADIAKITKFAKRYSRLGKLTNTFSTLSRVRDAIGNWFNDKIGKKVRLAIGAKLLRVGFISRFSRHAVTSWMKTGGMFTLVRGVTMAALQAIGFTIAGPVGNFVVAVLSDIVSDVLMKAAKPIIKFGAEVAILILAGIFGIIFLRVSSFAKIFSLYSHVSPQQVVQCGANTGLSPIIDDPDNPGGISPQGPMEPFVAGALDSGEQCLLGSGSFHCTQGPYGSFSHSKVAAMDIGGTNYFHAPSFCGNGGSCKITYVGDVNCAAGYAGGLVKFTAEYKGQTYEFKLIHVDSPLAAGQTLTSGQRVARTMEWHETGSKCSSGKHLHLETKLNGATVNPHDVLTKSPSQGGFGCGISTCP